MSAQVLLKGQSGLSEACTAALKLLLPICPCFSCNDKQPRLFSHSSLPPLTSRGVAERVMGNVKSQHRTVPKWSIRSMFPPQCTGRSFAIVMMRVVFAMQELLVMLMVATAT